MSHLKVLLEAIAILTGCIIGAGILGIPYMIVRSGFWTGMLVLGVLGIAFLILHLLIGEIALRTKGCYQLAGYAQLYLGRKGKIAMLLSLVIGVYGALVAYTIGVSESLASLFGGSPIIWGLIFYISMAWILFGNISMLGKSEVLMEVIKFTVFIIILFLLFFSPSFSVEKLQGFSIQRAFVPFGVILFALLGTAAIPEVRKELKSCPRLTKKIIIIGSLIPVVCYVLFAAAVVGTSGFLTTEVATIGLIPFTGIVGFILLNIFAVFAMSSSFAVLGFALKDSFESDFNIPHKEAWALTLAIPLMLLALGVTSFVRTLDIAGTVAGGIAGLLIIIMHAKARKIGTRIPEYQIKLNKAAYFLLGLIFALGILNQFFLFL